MKRIKLYKILTIVFALIFFIPGDKFIIPAGLGFLFFLTQSGRYFFAAMAYFGILVYFLISAINKSKKIFDDIIVIVAIVVSYVLLILNIKSYFIYADFLCWLSLGLYILFSALTLDLSVKVMLEKSRTEN